MVRDALKKEKIRELPVGEYDAVRTLRHALQQAERGDITDCIIIMMKRDTEGDGQDLDCTWSDMTRHEVLWLLRWFNSWLNKRYFGDFHSDDD